jgi:hypothetical protein
MDVRVFLSIRGKETVAQEIKDAKVRAGLLQMGRSVALTLEGVRCPTHQTGPRDVRVHVDAKGNGDLRYDACCAELSALIGKATS